MDDLREAQHEQEQQLRDDEDAAREAQAEREYWQGFSHFEAVTDATERWSR